MDDECRRILGELWTYVDRECPRALEEFIRGHLDDCPPCLHRVDFERAFKSLLEHRCRDSAPPHLLQQVITRLDLGPRA